MKIPARLEPLLEASLIDDVVAQLKSGKEADVYVVLSRGEYLCAKVYKESKNRSFKNSAQYTEGRKVRNSREARAMNSKSRYGRERMEAEWQNTEVDTLSALATAGVRVPRIYDYYEGVLLLEIIVDANGDAAPRLNDVHLTPSEARECHYYLMRQAVLMLCAGYVHGDFSEFNILLSYDGPVIIDLPQAVQSTATNAFQLFERDIVQLTQYLSRFAPDLASTNYAYEIWNLYQRGELYPDVRLTGQFRFPPRRTNVRGLMNEIKDVRTEAVKRRPPKR